MENFRHFYKIERWNGIVLISCTQARCEITDIPPSFEDMTSRAQLSANIFENKT